MLAYFLDRNRTALSGQAQAARGPVLPAATDLSAIRDLLAGAPERPWSLERLALRAGYSPIHLLRSFRRTYHDLKAKGIEFTKEPTEEFYGIEAVFKDGCGSWFSLTQRTKPA
jgi:hypothetical protein